jgi:hypothetical protein
LQDLLLIPSNELLVINLLNYRCLYSITLVKKSIVLKLQSQQLRQSKQNEAINLIHVKNIYKNHKIWIMADQTGVWLLASRAHIIPLIWPVFQITSVRKYCHLIFEDFYSTRNKW